MKTSKIKAPDDDWEEKADMRENCSICLSLFLFDTGTISYTCTYRRSKKRRRKRKTSTRGYCPLMERYEYASPVLA